MLHGTYVGSKLGINDEEQLDKSYLSKEQKRLLRRITEALGIGESEVLRQIFMDYAKSISLITEIIHETGRFEAD